MNKNDIDKGIKNTPTPELKARMGIAELFYRNIDQPEAKAKVDEYAGKLSDEIDRRNLKPLG